MLADCFQDGLDKSRSLESLDTSSAIARLENTLKEIVIGDCISQVLD